MKGVFFKTGSYLLTGLIHAVSLFTLYRIWQPIADWYLKQIPARGIDLYNSASYVSYLINHFALRVDGWKYTWFSGVPFSLDYPSLFFYFMLPFSSYFGLVKGIQIFALVANFVFIAFAYLLFAELSKNRILASVLALATAYSVHIYRSLVYAGGIPVFTAQLFFPLVLYLILKFIRTGNKRFLLLAGALSGIGFLGHPQNLINFVFPSVFLLLFFSSYGGKFFSLSKIKNIFLYFFVSILIGFPQFYPIFFEAFFVRVAALFHINLLGIAPPEVTTKATDPQVVAWARNQFFVAFSDTNSAIFYLLAIAIPFFIIGILIGKSRLKTVINTIAVGLVAAWVIFYIYLLSIGVDIYHGGLEAWYKLFWSMPIAIGMVASQCWGVFVASLSDKIKNQKIKIIFLFGLEGLSGAMLVAASFIFFSSYTKGFFHHLDKDISVFVSGFPEALSGHFTNKELTKLTQEVKPTFMNDTPGDYRLYSNDQTVSIWWNALFKIPLARGYIDPPLTLKDRWGYFWMDAAFSLGKNGGSSLGNDWDTPEEVVERNTSFLLDWFSIKYLEGNHGASGGTGGLAQSLTSEKFVDSTEQRETTGGIVRTGQPGEDYWSYERTQRVPFYKIKDELVSPIHQATNAPAVLVLGGGDSYDITTRVFAMLGLSSQSVIVARGSTFLDDVSLSQMLDFDAIMLYKYNYRNASKAWEKVAKYLEKGGKVFLETGAEVKESSSADLPGDYNKELPDLFPIKQTKRSDLGADWDAEVFDESILENTNMHKFSDFIFDKNPWNLSYPPKKNLDLRDNAKVLLTVHGYPILVERDFGKGKVIWSGINLPYHVLYNFNFEEGQLFRNIIGRFFSFGGDSTEYTLDWVSPEKRVINTKSAKGVLIKEQHFPGWRANVRGKGGNKDLAIYNVGPVSPGFMYVRIPQQMRGDTALVSFSYKGSFMSWVATIMSIVTILAVLDYILFHNIVGKLTYYNLWKMIRKKTNTWWEKEEE